ncbi:hypothetical protein MASR2M32_28410 [Sphaerotilus sulfidivorans]
MITKELSGYPKSATLGTDRVLGPTRTLRDQRHFVKQLQRGGRRAEASRIERPQRRREDGVNWLSSVCELSRQRYDDASVLVSAQT